MGSSRDILLIEDNGMDMHSYEMSINDVVAISNADVFIYIGRESGVDDILSLDKNKNLNTLKLLDHVVALEESSNNIVVGDEHDHDHDHEHHENAIYDEHIWLSVKNLIVMTEAIRDKLLEVFPDNLETINSNSGKYIDKLLKLENSYAQVCQNTDKKFVVADRFPFLYLTHDYSMDYFAVFSGCSDETQASPSTITEVIDYINNNSVDYIYVLESSNQKIANQVVCNRDCRAGVQVLVLNSCQYVTNRNLDSVSLYDIMENNLEMLKKAL